MTRAVRRRLATGLAAILGLSTATVAITPGIASSASATAVSITVGGSAGQHLPMGFLGLVFETSVLANPSVLDVSSPSTDGTNPSTQSLTSLMNMLGPATLRFGGTSSEQTDAFVPPSATLPSWAKGAITPASFATLAQLAKATGWTIDLGVPLFHFNPQLDAEEVQAASQALGSSLGDVEIGNEPDLYTYRDKTYTWSDYLTNYTKTEAAITQSVPGVKIAGSDMYTSLELQQLGQSSLPKRFAKVTQHMYPYADCSNAPFPASTLLSWSAISLENWLINQVQTKVPGLPVDLDEFNSISCKNPATAREFASTLWSLDALLDAADRGVSSVNIQSDPDNCQTYTPFCDPDPNYPGALQQMPIFESMRMVAGLEGSTFLTVAPKASTTLPTGVRVYALKRGDGSTVVVVDNKSATPVSSFTVNAGSSMHLTSTQSLTATAQPNSPLTASTDVTLGPVQTVAPGAAPPPVPAYSALEMVFTPSAR